jgi:hypothetical protein
MANRIVVKKATLRVAFATSASNPIQLDALWPPAEYNTFVYTAPIKDARVFSEPWNFVLVDGTPTYVEAPTPYDLSFGKAVALCQIVRAVNRHRRMTVKEDLLGQDQVYAMKVAEAYSLQAGTRQIAACPFLAVDASLDNISVNDAATLVIFRHEQNVALLLHSETRRRELIRKVLKTGNKQELDNVVKEITAYERRG